MVLNFQNDGPSSQIQLSKLPFEVFFKKLVLHTSSNFTRLALDLLLHAPFHFTHLTFWSFFVAFLIKIMTFFPLCNNLDQLCMVVRCYVHTTLHMRYQRYHIKLQKHQKFGIELICFNNILYKHIAAHFLLHKIILFSQKKQCTVRSQSPKLYQMIS